MCNNQNPTVLSIKQRMFDYLDGSITWDKAQDIEVSIDKFLNWNLLSKNDAAYLKDELSKLCSKAIEVQHLSK